jgi:ATP-dependent protease Clp ATPase subunit
VIGQPLATRILAVSVYNHFKRVTLCPRPVHAKQQPTGGSTLLPSFPDMQHTTQTKLGKDGGVFMSIEM